MADVSYGNWVRRRRKALDLTQTELARRVGCARTTIEKIEANGRRPSIAMAERLADALELAPALWPAFLSSARSGMWASDDATPARPPDTPSAEPDRFAGALPVPATPLIGRAAEVAAICQALAATPARVLVVTGPGGIGKTRLALQVAADLEAAFADGIAFVDLAPIRDPALVPVAIARAFGQVDAGEQPILVRLQATLRERRVLLVLDNFEHLLGAASVLAVLLAAAPRLKMLLTSRVVTGIYGEYVYAAPPLPLPDRREPPELDRFLEVETVRLFAERAQAAQPDFVLTKADADTVSAICHALDGLPLAIELAAARVRFFSPRALLQRLRGDPTAGSPGRLDVLSGGARTLPARQQTLRATLTWSYDLLDADCRKLFRWMAVFVGGCALDAVEHIWMREDDRALDLLLRLQALLDNSLVQRRVGVDGEARFHMLETIHEYAREQLVASGELQRLQQRHADYFVTLATAKAPDTTEAEGRWWDRMEREMPNFRAALTWCSSQQDPDIGLRLAVALTYVWRGRGYLSEGRGWLAQLTHRPVEFSPPAPAMADLALRAEALSWLGTLGVFQGDFTGGPVFQESLALYRALGDRAGMADVLGDLGMMLQMKGDDERARECLEQSLTLARELGNEDKTATTLFFLGTLAYGQGNSAQAGALWHESMARFTAMHNHWFEALIWMHLALLAVEQGEDRLAEAQAAQSLTLFRDLNDHVQIVHALEIVACVAAAHGQRAGGATPRLQRAARIFGATDALRQAEGIWRLRYFQRFYEQGVSAVATHLSDADRAAAWAEGKALSLARVIDDALQPMVARDAHQ